MLNPMSENNLSCR